MQKRQWIMTAAGAMVALLCGHSALAQGKFPDRPITIVVPSAPGGSTDFTARLIAEPLSRALGQPVVVDNKAGASGNIGNQIVAKAKPDGYTLLLAYSGFQVGNPHLFKKTGWDPIKDFAPVSMLTRAPQVLATRANLPVNNVRELIAFAKANPDKLNYASSGNGSMLQLNMELLKSQYGIFLTHIPYRAAGTSLTDLMAGQVHAMFTNIQASNVGYVNQGKLRALAVASPGRSEVLPQVPTFGELKQPELNMTSWTGLAAPAGTPDAIVEQLYAAMRTVLQDPATIAAWKRRGSIAPEAVSPAEYRQEISNRIEFYKKLIKTNNLSLD